MSILADSPEMVAKMNTQHLALITYRCITSARTILLVLEKFGETKYLRMYWPSITCFVGYTPRNILKIERLHESQNIKQAHTKQRFTLLPNLPILTINFK